MPVQSVFLIHKGEQFSIPFDVKINDVIATPEDLDGVRIKVFGKLREWPDGELTYDDEENAWLYPLDQDQTRGKLPGASEAQVAVKIGNDILKTDVFGIEVKNSIIMEPWNDDG